MKNNNTGCLEYFSENPNNIHWRIKNTYNNNKCINFAFYSASDRDKANSMISSLEPEGYKCKISGLGEYLTLCNYEDSDHSTGTLDLCDVKVKERNKRDTFIGVDKGGYDVKCVGQYTLLCIRKGYTGIGLHLYKQNGGWRLETYGEDKVVDAYIQSVDTCEMVQEQLKRVTENWYCDIRRAGQELKFEEGGPIKWNNQCDVSLPEEELIDEEDDKINRNKEYDSKDGTLDLCTRSDRFITVSKGGWDIKCPGQYTRVCIRNDQENSLRFYEDKNGWRLKAEDSLVYAYIQSLDSCALAKNDFENSKLDYWCDISIPGHEIPYIKKEYNYVKKYSNEILY